MKTTYHHVASILPVLNSPKAFQDIIDNEKRVITIG